MNEVQALKLAFAMTLTRIVGCPQAEAETLVEKMHEALRVKAAEKTVCWCNGSRNCGKPCHPDTGDANWKARE